MVSQPATVDALVGGALDAGATSLMVLLLGVADVAASKRFYVDHGVAVAKRFGRGWSAARAVGVARAAG